MCLSFSNQAFLLLSDYPSFLRTLPSLTVSLDGMLLPLSFIFPRLTFLIGVQSLGLAGYLIRKSGQPFLYNSKLFVGVLALPQFCPDYRGTGRPRRCVRRTVYLCQQRRLLLTLPRLIVLEPRDFPVETVYLAIDHSSRTT